MDRIKRNDKIRIALVCTSIPLIGGKNIHMINLYKYLNDVTFRVFIVYSSRVDDELRTFLIKKGVREEDFVLISRFKKWLVIPCILELRRFFLNNKIDIVHTFQIQSDILGGLAARMAGVKFMLSMHESKIIEENISIIKQLFYRLTNKIIKKWFIRTTVISYGLRQELISGKFRPDDKIEVIHPGYDLLEKYKFYKPSFDKLKKGKPLIGIIGGLRREKGQCRFIAAMPFILQELPEARFIIVGKGWEEQRLKKQARKLNLDSRVNFTGWVEDIFPFLETIDIFVVPSEREGFGMVILEAFMLSKPVVASNIEGIKDIIDDGKNGLLVDTANPRLFANKILYLCNNPEKAILLGKNGYEKVTTQFTIEREMAKMRQLYLNAIE